MKISPFRVGGRASMIISAVLLLIAVVLLFMPESPLIHLRKQKVRSEIEDLQMSVRNITEYNQTQADGLAVLTETRKTGISAQDEQDAMLQFRERIDSAVTEAGIQIRNLGNVHKVELADNLFLLEVQFSADGKTAGAVAFLRTAMEDHPRLFWEVITVKPGTETLNITGTICSVCMIRQNVPKEGK